MLALLITIFLACPSLIAQTANRITQAVDAGQVRALPNHHPQWANAENSASPVPGNELLNQFTLVLSRSPQQEAAFDKFLADQQNPASADYHHWLTPSEVGDRFGLSEQDIAAVSGWLQSQGLHVNWVSPSRIFIGFGGRAADVGAAFQTELYNYRVNGVERMSVSSDPMIPAALAPAIKTIRGLYTIEDQPQHQMVAAQVASPQLTGSSGNHYIAPGDFAQIYDFSSPSFAGAGQTIGIVGRARTNPADFNNFKTLTETVFTNPTEIVPVALGGVDPGPALTAPPASGVSFGDQSEATLDVSRAGSIAQGAHLLLVVSSKAGGGIETDAQYLVNTTPVPAQIMTISFGACESSAGPSGVSFWDALFKTAAAEGISSFVSSGDSGASGCDTSFAAPPASPAANSPNYICSSSYATCVGGTEFVDSTNPSQYWMTTNSPNLASVYSYIPEGGWNDPLNSSSAPQMAASGGGVSSIIPTPAWQTGTGVPAIRSGRYTPDIAFSSSCHDSYFTCFAAGGGSCVVTNNSFRFMGFCGTSAAAPSMAGIAALLNQQWSSAQGNLNQGFYLAAALNPSVFHDVTVASSGVTNCDVNTPSMCNNSAPGSAGLSGGQAGYQVGTGYDEVTGLGSLNVAYFLTSYMSKLTPTVTVTPASSSIGVLLPLSVTVAVSGPSGQPAPTGSVVLSNGNYTSAATPLTSGSASFTIPAGSLIPGYNNLLASYTPDTASEALYATATGENSVTLQLLISTITITPTPSTVTTAQPLTVTVSVNGVTGQATPTGSVSLGSGLFSGASVLTAGSATFTIAAGILAVGNDLMGAMYTPDSQSFRLYSGASTTGSVTVTGTASLTPTVTVTPATYEPAKVNPLPITVTVSGGTGNPVPTGTITLMGGGFSSSATALVGGTVTITIPGGVLTPAVDTIIALYAPDSASATTYNNTSGSSTFSVWNPSKSVPIMTFFPSATSITTSQPLTMTVTVSSNGGYPITTGSVVLSGGGFTSAPSTLTSNSTTFSIPAGVLAVGSDTLTASYTPDAMSSAIFSSVSQTLVITVATPPPPSFTITGTYINLVPGATAQNISLITVTPIGGFTGSVALTATVTSRPANALDPPTFSFGSTSPVGITDAIAGSANLTISTTAPTACTATNKDHALPWYTPGSAVLACLLFFVVPARRRWRTMLGMLVLLVTLVGGVMACGGGGGGPATCTSVISGTTPGTYIVTVTGKSGATTETGTFNFTVQ